MRLYKPPSKNYYGDVLDEKDLKKIKEIFKDELESKLETQTRQLRDEFRHELKIEGLRIRDDIKSEIRLLKSDLARANRNIDTILDFFDREYLDLRSRVERIESVLNLKPLAASV